MLTLRNRLALVNMLVFLLTFVVLVGVLAGQLLSHLYEQLDQELALAGERVVERAIWEHDTPHLLESDNRLASILGDQGFARLLDPKGTILAGTGDFHQLAVAPRALSAPENGIAFNQRTDNGKLLRVYTRPVLTGVGRQQGIRLGYVQTAAVPEEVLETVDQIRRSLVIATPLALLVVGLGGFLAARRALRPLTVMAQSAAAISAESLTERRLPVPRAEDEVQALALAFNAMLDRLAAAFTRQRRFTADASHELRTPVTAILGQAELALSRPRTPDAYTETLRRIQSEGARMQRLIARMLALARAESGQQILEFAATDVAEVLRTLTNALTPAMEARSIELKLNAPATVVVDTDADSLTQILLNLLENAVAHTAQGQIVVTLASDSAVVRITILDSGPGIDPEHLPQIFSPFYRVDPSREHTRGSVGLGLALAYELTQLLGGRIEGTNHPEGGAIFTLTLPAQPPSKPVSKG